jgi:hypothetical protein
MATKQNHESARFTVASRFENQLERAAQQRINTRQHAIATQVDADVATAQTPETAK